MEFSTHKNATSMLNKYIFSYTWTIENLLEFYIMHKLDCDNISDGLYHRHATNYTDYNNNNYDDEKIELGKLEETEYRSPIAKNEHVEIFMKVFPIKNEEIGRDDDSDYDNYPYECGYSEQINRFSVYPLCLSVHIYCKISKEVQDVPFYFEVFLLGKDNEKLKVFKKDKAQVKNGEINNLGTFVDYRNLVKEPEKYLPNNNLVLKCEIKYLVFENRSIQTKQSKHFTHLANDFGAFWNKREKFSDLTLVIKGASLHAHKVVLAARSPFFEAKFKETHENRIELNDFDVNVFETLLEYMYTGNAQLIDKTNIQLISAGKKLGINVFKSICEPPPSSEISADTKCKPSTSGITSTADKKGIKRKVNAEL